MAETTENVTIIGSGPAALTAALYTSRADLEPIMFEGAEAGGQLMITTEVENYPGYPDGTTGPQMIADMRKQAERFGTRLVTANVDKVDFTQGSPFTLWVGDQEIRTRAVIVSTGANARFLGLENEQRLLGKGVSACATCDGFFFRDQELVVVGGGDSAMEESLFLTKFASKVTVVHRRDQLRASKIMQDRAFASDKIEWAWNKVVVDVFGDQTVEGVVLEDTQTGERSELASGGLFLAIGHDPATSLFTDQLELDEAGYILVDEPTTATSVPGVFAGGDVVDTIYRQAVTAAGQGCKAAIDAERWIEANHGT
jgi:thioredoxin reductase (NADPH)